jgi:hypothetical protein
MSPGVSTMRRVNATSDRCCRSLAFAACSADARSARICRCSIGVARQLVELRQRADLGGPNRA